MVLTKEYVITEISASPDGSPYVLISLKGPEEVGGPQRASYTPFESYTSMDDMLKNLGSIISRQMIGGFTTVIKLGLDEYDRLEVKVGDRVSLELDKIQVGVP